jgi:hypothetical protein
MTKKQLNPFGWNRVVDHAECWGVSKGRISQLIKQGRLETNGKTGKKLRVRGYLANWKVPESETASRPQVDRAGPRRAAQCYARRRENEQPATIENSDNNFTEQGAEEMKNEKRPKKSTEKEAAKKTAKKVSAPIPKTEMYMTYEEARIEKLKADARLAKLKADEKSFAVKAGYCNAIATAFVKSFVPLKQKLLELDLNKRNIDALSGLIDECLQAFENTVQDEIIGNLPPEVEQ